MRITSASLNRYEKAAIANCDDLRETVALPGDFEDDPPMWRVTLQGKDEVQCGILGVLAFDHLNPEYGLLKDLSYMGQRMLLGSGRMESVFKTYDTLDMQCLSGMRWSRDQAAQATAEILAEETALHGVLGAFEIMDRNAILPTLEHLSLLIDEMEIAGVFPEA